MLPSPVSSVNAASAGLHSSCVIATGMTISAPNFCAWTNARLTSAMPDMPVGKPK
jgi:hypothetical protein